MDNRSLLHPRNLSIIPALRGPKVGQFEVWGQQFFRSKLWPRFQSVYTAELQPLQVWKTRFLWFWGDFQVHCGGAFLGSNFVKMDQFCQISCVFEASFDENVSFFSKKPGWKRYFSEILSPFCAHSSRGGLQILYQGEGRNSGASQRWNRRPAGGKGPLFRQKISKKCQIELQKCGKNLAPEGRNYAQISRKTGTYWTSLIRAIVNENIRKMFFLREAISGSELIAQTSGKSADFWANFWTPIWRILCQNYIQNNHFLGCGTAIHRPPRVPP